jgi:hypothetical protein
MLLYRTNTGIIPAFKVGVLVTVKVMVVLLMTNAIGIVNQEGRCAVTCDERAAASAAR